MYDFIDTTDTQADRFLPSEAMNINGEFLEDVISGYRTLTVSGRELLSSEIERMQIGRTDGEKELYSRLPIREITVQYQLLTKSPTEFRGAFNKLNYKLKQEKSTIIFNDEPDKYFIGTKSEIDSVPTGVNNITSTFTILCTDPIKYTINPRIFNNIKPGTTGENLVLDPEFRYKDKYWKSWAHLLNETHDGSNILRADFSTPSAGANDPTAGNWFQVNSASTRIVTGLKVGSAFSASVDVRIMQGSTQATTTSLVIEERTGIGGTLLKRHIVAPAALSLGTWQTLSLVNYKVTNSATKALNLAVSCYDGGIVDISKPLLNLGATLIPYAEPAEQLTETMEIMNQGTYRAWPIIRAKMNGENGLVAFANNKGAVLQFGNPEETDIKTGKRSDKVLDIPMRNNGSLFTFNDGGITTYPNYVGDATRPNLAQGSVSWTLAGDGMTPVFSTGSATAWHGPRARITTIPKNYANLDTGDFKFENRINFDTNAKKQGRIEMVVGSGTDYIMAMTVRDSNPSKDEIIVEFHTIRGLQKSITLDRKKFTGAYFGVDMTRDGQKLEFKFTRPKQVNADKVVSVSATESLTINCPEAYGLPVTELSCWFQRFQTTNHVGMQWWDSKFTWINEPTVSNVPNTFNDGDLLEIDVRKRLVMVNGVENNQLHALGNMWEGFALDTGVTTIQPVASSWANMYECEIEVQEAYV